MITIVIELFAKLVASDGFRRLYIAFMFALAFIPLWNARQILLYCLPHRMASLVEQYVKRLRRVGLQQALNFKDNYRALLEILESSKDSKQVKAKLMPHLKRTKDADVLSNSTFLAVSAIQRCQKNYLLSHGLLPTAPIIHRQMSEQLLSFRFWGPFQAKLGLFGTFLGISAGLVIMSAGLKDVQSDTSSSPPAVVSADPRLTKRKEVASSEGADTSKRSALIIQDVIASCATAFDTSVVGLLFAIIFSYADRRFSRRIQRLVAPVAANVDAFASEWALTETDSLDKSLETLRSVVSNLHDAAVENGKSAQALINGFVMELDSAFSMLRTEMTQAVQEAMDDRFTEHLKSVEIIDTRIKELLEVFRDRRKSDSQSAIPNGRKSSHALQDVDGEALSNQA